MIGSSHNDRMQNLMNRIEYILDTAKRNPSSMIGQNLFFDFADSAINQILDEIQILIKSGFVEEYTIDDINVEKGVVVMQLGFKRENNVLEWYTLHIPKVKSLPYSPKFFNSNGMGIIITDFT